MQCKLSHSLNHVTKRERERETYSVDYSVHAVVYCSRLQGAVSKGHQHHNCYTTVFLAANELYVYIYNIYTCTCTCTVCMRTLTIIAHFWQHCKFLCTCTCKCIYRCTLYMYIHDVLVWRIVLLEVYSCRAIWSFLW